MSAPLLSRGSFVAAASLLTLACARQENGPSTTALTSAHAPIPRDELSLRIADEMCHREAACNGIGERGDARYRSDEACMSEQGALSPDVVARWRCTPRGASASFEECLVAIRSERCDTLLDRADRLAACRRAAVCAAPVRQNDSVGAAR